MQRNYRQGEVLIFEVPIKERKNRYPKGWQKKAKAVKDNVIIEGELAGHKHEVINGKLYDHPKKKDIMVLEAKKGCIIIHPEHDPIPVPVGTFEIKIQREYSSKGARKVKD